MAVSEKEPKKMGRPRKEFDQTQFEKLCQLQCTEQEIADWFDFSRDTLDERCREQYGDSFSTVYNIKRSEGKVSLRRSQFQLAQKNAAMSIFLGKNYLNQKEDPSVLIDQSSLTIKFEWKAPDAVGTNNNNSIPAADVPDGNPSIEQKV